MLFNTLALLRLPGSSACAKSLRSLFRPRRIHGLLGGGKWLPICKVAVRVQTLQCRKVTYGRSVDSGGLRSSRLFAQDMRGTPGPLVPVQAIVTVDARHNHESNVPSLRQEDFMVYAHQRRLADQRDSAKKADLEFFVAIDDASGSSLGS
jgi:hypothetical protein